MLNRVTIATFFAILVGLFAASTATAASPSDRAPIPPPTDYWQDKGFILMAHQGGEWDFPPNTMYAYKQAIALGADMIDMDGWVTSDGEIVLTHDRDANDNSDAPNDTFITDTPISQLKTYDFAYKWSPHDGSSTTPFKGVATGDAPPPTGFTAADFRIPTFGEVLAAFPDTPINIELKQTAGLTPTEITDTAEKMAAILDSHPGHDENVIINSFGQAMLDAVHLARPEHKSFGGSQNATLAYIQGQPITPTPVAVEPPDKFNLPPVLDTVPILKPWADHDGYRIFVWGSDLDATQDTPEFYAKLISQGANSYNTPSPTTLAAYLCTAGIAKPDGSPRCPGQVCPAGQTGIAPNNCVDIPVCPEGMTGTPPDCVAPTAADLRIKSIRGPKKVRAGSRFKIDVALSNPGGQVLPNASICMSVPQSSGAKVKKGSCVNVKSISPGKIVHRDLAARTTANARGKFKVIVKARGSFGNTASGGWTGKVVPGRGSCQARFGPNAVCN